MSGCTEKYIYEGEFKNIERPRQKLFNQYWSGIFKSVDGEEMSVSGDSLEYAKENVKVRATFECVSWTSVLRLIHYEYLEDYPTEKEIVIQEVIVETELSLEQQNKIDFVDWFSGRFPLRYAIYHFRFERR